MICGSLIRDGDEKEGGSSTGADFIVDSYASLSICPFLIHDQIACLGANLATHCTNHLEVQNPRGWDMDFKPS